MDLITLLNILDISTLLPLIDIETLVKLYLNSNLFRTLLERATLVLCTYHQLPLDSSRCFKDFVSSYDYLRLSERTFSYIGLNQALIRASREGHLSLVQHLLSQGATVRGPAVAKASEGGHTQVVQLLLSNTEDDSMWSETRIAFVEGHMGIVEFVLDNHSDLYDHILCAARGGNLDLVKRMDHIITEGGMLVAAYYSGNQDLIQYILSKTDSNIDVHYCALSGSAMAGNLGLFTSLSEKSTKDLSVHLASAVLSGNIDIVKLILSKCPPYPNTVINLATLAAVRGNKELMLMLLGERNDFELCVGRAAISGHLDLVQLMLDKGVTNYNSIMNDAARYGHIHIVQLMLDKGATNYTQCLTSACEGGYLDIIRLMLSKGAVVTDEAIEDTDHLHCNHVDIHNILCDVRSNKRLYV